MYLLWSGSSYFEVRSEIEFQYAHIRTPLTTVSAVTVLYRERVSNPHTVNQLLNIKFTAYLRLYGQSSRGSKRKSAKVEKIKCILHYFQRVLSKSKK